MSRERLDLLLVRRGLVESREKAQRLILAGRVRVNGHPQTKQGSPVEESAEVTLTGAERYVSRGGDKLEAALRHFQLDVRGCVALDIGASTGGFTDCLLQHGAAKVYAVDVGRGQLHGRLRADPRVTILDGVNARTLSAGLIPKKPGLAVLDVSFISLEKVMPAVVPILAARARLVTLIKPQFEAGRKQVEKGGVVRDPAVRQQAVERIRAFGTTMLGLSWDGCCESPLKGPAGNVEFLAAWTKG